MRKISFNCMNLITFNRIRFYWTLMINAFLYFFHNHYVPFKLVSYFISVFILLTCSKATKALELRLLNKDNSLLEFNGLINLRRCKKYNTIK